MTQWNLNRCIYNSPISQIPQCTDKYHTMHHFVTDICTYLHISVTKWCIVGDGTGWCIVRYGTGALCNLCNRSIGPVAFSEKWYWKRHVHRWMVSFLQSLIKTHHSSSSYGVHFLVQRLVWVLAYSLQCSIQYFARLPYIKKGVTVIISSWKLAHLCPTGYKQLLVQVMTSYWIDGLIQDCSISIANALEILRYCIKLLKCSDKPLPESIMMIADTSYFSQGWYLSPLLSFRNINMCLLFKQFLHIGNLL